MRKLMCLALLLLLASPALAQGKKKDQESPLADPARWQGTVAETLVALSEAIEDIDSADSRHLARAGVLKLRAGDATGAAALFDRAEASDRDDDEAFAMIAEAYGAQEMWSEADAWFLKATQVDPRDVDHRALWGVAYWNRGERERAIELFVAALASEGRNARIHYRIGTGIR
jgi:tetratricopeptide (TPR) repeat protein